MFEIYNKNKKTVKTILGNIVHSLNLDQVDLNLEAHEKYDIIVGAHYYLVGVCGKYRILRNINETDEIFGMSDKYVKHIEKRDALFNECEKLYNIKLTPQRLTDIFSFGVYEWDVSYDTHRLIEEE